MNKTSTGPPSSWVLHSYYYNSNTIIKRLQKGINALKEAKQDYKPRLCKLEQNSVN